MRIFLVALVVGAAAVMAIPAAGERARVGTGQYVVRVDPRLCPSPLCGGYWAALANRARTLCGDGRYRPRCYVATAVDEDRRPLASIPDGALVRGELEPRTYEGFGDLGALVAASVREPAGPEARGVYYRVRDTGVRCVRAPCFSLRAVSLNAGRRTAISQLDLAPARLDGSQRARARRELAGLNGLLLLGVVHRTEGERLLHALRVYLTAATPRA